MILPHNTRSYLAIDIGNTRTKIAFFADKESILANHPPARQWVTPTQSLAETLNEILSILPPNVLLTVGYMSTASVINISVWECWNQMETPPHFCLINADFAFPIKNLYATPKTLGTDRIVAVIGALASVRDCPVLVVDAGTAITYDFANQKGEYLGGGIAAGIRMRFRALHEFTARLPLVETVEHTDLVGNSTLNSMMSGVVNGTIAEIQGIINQYKTLFGAETRIFLTGGDAVFLAEKLQLIDSIEADLVLKGIGQLLV